MSNRKQNASRNNPAVNEPPLPAIYTGKVCQYCKADTELVSSKEIYGTHYCYMYLCRPCKAYVGCHGQTDISLGSVANEELREWRKAAKSWFNPLWQAKKAKGEKSARKRAYAWMRDAMGTEINTAHIGMFDIEQCKRLIDLCRPYYKSKPASK